MAQQVRRSASRAGRFHASEQRSAWNGPRRPLTARCASVKAQRGLFKVERAAWKRRRGVSEAHHPAPNAFFFATEHGCAPASLVTSKPWNSRFKLPSKLTNRASFVPSPVGPSGVPYPAVHKACIPAVKHCVMIPETRFPSGKSGMSGVARSLIRPAPCYRATPSKFQPYTTPPFYTQTPHLTRALPRSTLPACHRPRLHQPSPPRHRPRRIGPRSARPSKPAHGHAPSFSSPPSPWA